MYNVSQQSTLSFELTWVRNGARVFCFAETIQLSVIAPALLATTGWFGIGAGPLPGGKKEKLLESEEIYCFFPNYNLYHFFTGTHCR